jgi:ferredoxin
VFESRDDGTAIVLDVYPSGSLRPKILEAVRACPRQAIALTDETP